MQSWLEFLTVPTRDGTGTLLVLHASEKKYILGQASEGSLRMIQSSTSSLRNVSDIILSGRLGWDTMGGIVGIILSLAEAKAAALAKLKAGKPEVDPKVDKIRLFGPLNLTYAIATMRRYIFRTGVAVDVNEVSPNKEPIKPTWSDDKIQVWAMPINPGDHANASRPASRKRSHSEAQDEQGEESTAATSSSQDEYKAVVHDMFASNWSARELVETPLSEVIMPAAIFIRNPDTGKIDHYSGPLPGGDEPLPDIEVLVRAPWPGAKIAEINPVESLDDAVSYIITHHPQRGKFLPKKAKEYKVPPGPLFAVLTSGSSVQNSDGETITPDMVMEPSRPGRGFAVLDIPSSAYIPSLLSRSEWLDSELTGSLQAVVWILGEGLKDDHRILAFQKTLSQAQHIVSSRDACPDAFSFKQAVDVAWLRSFVDSSTFPEMDVHPTENDILPTTTDTSDKSLKNVAIRAQPGFRVHLEPKPDVDTANVTAPMDLAKLKAAVIADAERIGVDVADQQSKLDVGKAKAWSETIPNNDTEIITLGTGSGTPGLLRNVSGTLVRVPGQGSYLLDCGEGTLGTLRRMFSEMELKGIMRDLKMIWISHLHADHHLGITSMIREWSRTMYGNDFATDVLGDMPQLPVVSHSHMLQWLKEFSTVDDMGYSRIIPIAIMPNPKGPASFCIYKGTTVLEDVTGDEKEQLLKKMSLNDLNAIFINHCYGAMAMTATTDSGFKFSYSGDCRPNLGFTEIGKGSHVLIHEATFEDNMYGEAKAKKHSTAGEALIVADKMEARGLVLTHMSQRYYHSSSFTLSLRNQNVASNDDDGEREGILDVEASPEAGSAVAIEPSENPASSKAHALEVNRIVAKDHIKIVSAYDYMRLTVKNMPKIQNLQPAIDVFSDHWNHLTSQDKELPPEPNQPNGDDGPESKQTVV